MLKNLFKFKTLDKQSEGSSHKDEHGLLPVRLYIAVFVALLIMIFINIGIAHLPIPGFWITMALIFVAVVQTLLVVVFFMELIHEDRFYSFIFGSSILFMLLFFGISLAELRNRDFFYKDEGIKIMRGVDQNGNFAPGGPKLEKPSESSSEHHK